MTNSPNGVRKKILLLLDTGDNCRCPMAEGYLKKLLAERGIDWIEIKTAGVMTPTGILPTPEAVSLLKEDNVDITRHKSRPMKVSMLEEADLIIGFSSLHVQRAIRDGGDAVRGKTYLLKEYVGFVGKDVQIPDPMGGTMDTFKRVFEQIKIALEKLVETDFIKTPPEGWRELKSALAVHDAEETTEVRSAEWAAASAELAAQEEHDQSEGAASRVRGRSKKNVEPGSAVQAAEKPKRGRPRKSETDEGAAVQAKTTKKKSAATAKTVTTTQGRAATTSKKARPTSKTAKATSSARTSKRETPKSAAAITKKKPKAQTAKKVTARATRRKSK